MIIYKSTIVSRISPSQVFHLSVDFFQQSPLPFKELLSPHYLTFLAAIFLLLEIVAELLSGP